VLEIESITIIDECDEDIYSPDRGEAKKLEPSSQADIKLRNLSAQNDKPQNMSEQYSFYMESSSSESYKEKKKPEHAVADH
jgi:hypothetical protein